MAEARLHHLGYVVADIAEALPRWSASLDARSVSETFHDPLQKVRVVFLEPAEQGARIELVAPAADDSPVSAFLARGGGLHHVCYEVDDLEEQIRTMAARRAILVRPPKPAVAFGGRRIAWMTTRERMLIEYVERSPAEGPAE